MFVVQLGSCSPIYRLACFLQNQRAIAVFGLSSTTTNLCSSATSPHLTHLWYIVNHYHLRIFDPKICLSSTMSRYFLSILNRNHLLNLCFLQNQRAIAVFGLSSTTTEVIMTTNLLLVIELLHPDVRVASFFVR